MYSEANNSKSVRCASHAGSWYEKDSHELDSQLSGWLSGTTPNRRPSRAVIVPHAGYSYSGPCAAHAFNQLSPQNMELEATGEFGKMSKHQDEDEHSIEMQIPYLAKIMQSCKHAYTIIPIVVGSLSTSSESKYGAIFAKYLEDRGNVFIISSDFCHWGSRFRYTNFDRNFGEIWQFIEAMDHEGMELIENLSASGFRSYLKKTGNTICGRHPISVFLRTIECYQSTHNLKGFEFKFIKYAQSSKCHDMCDSSVSYAAGSLQES